MAETRQTSTFATIFLWLAIIGAINWGLVGFFNFNLVDAIFGGASAHDTTGLSRIVYAVVGLAGLALVFLLPKVRGPGRAAA